MRIIYYCNNPRKPTGGVSVIYHHIKKLNEMGIKAAVLHARRGYKYYWLQENIPTISDKDIRENDYFVIPEISAPEVADKLVPLNISYGIFVQNGYYLSYCSREYTYQDIDFSFQHASHILSISDDTSQMIKLHYPALSNRVIKMASSIDATLFNAFEEKDNVICFMPRKNRLHTATLIFALKKHLPSHWRIVPIDNLTQTETAAILRKSRIFLSFSDLEGLGLPPLEAALCGNYVIGYHGGGGLEYWREPNFEKVSVGDMQDFIEKIQNRIKKIESDHSLNALQPGIDYLQNQYSNENETQHLMQFVDLAQAHVNNKSNRIVDIKLQKRMSFQRLFRRVQKEESGFVQL